VCCLRLQQISKGRRVRIVGFEVGVPRAHLLSMGLRKGAEFTLLGQAPLGDPAILSLRGYCLSVRHADAAALCLQYCDGGEAVCPE
jgi:ferrous iron transport protein A